MTHFNTFVTVFAVVAITCCRCANETGNAGGQIGDDSTTTEPTALEKGMEPIFNMYRNFLDTVMSTDFYSANDDFDVNDLIKVVKNDDYAYLRENTNALVSTFGGYAACIIIGLIFVVFMPIVGLIYCCVHCCCHKCGGTREERDPKHASCKKWTLTIILLISVTMMLVGCIIMFLGSELVHRAFNNDDRSSFMGRVDESIGHLEAYTNDTVTEFQLELEKRAVDQGINVILPEIKNAVENTVTRIQNTIDSTNLLNQAGELGEVAQQANTDLEKVKTSLTVLVALQTNVTNVLVEVTNEINAACSPSVNCPTMSLTVNPDYSTLDDLTAEASKVAGATGISALVTAATNEFNNVADSITGEVNNLVNETEIEVKKINTTISEKKDEVANSFTDALVKEFQRGRKPFQDSATKDDIKNVGDIIWYVCIGMGCTVLLVVLFYYLGVLFGLCGERASYSASCCNRGTGANLLCTGICCTFLFAWILMLMLVILFTLGGLMYSLGCKPLKDGVENVAKFEVVISDGFNFNLSSTVGIQGFTIASALSNCKDNKPLYSALRLDGIIDLDKDLNISTVIMDVKKIADNAIVTIPNVELMSPALKTQLLDFGNSSLSDVNYTKYTVELAKPVFDGNELENMINALEVANATYPTLGASAQKLRDLQNGELQDIDSEKAALSAAINNLETNAKNASVMSKIEELITAIEASQSNFNANKSIIVNEELSNAVNSIADIVNQTFEGVKDAIQGFGECRPIYDAAQGLVDAVCVVTLDPLNSVWFGLGWSLFFYIPCFICAAMLAGLYKRQKPYKKRQEGFDSIHQPYNGYHADDDIPLTRMQEQKRPRSSNGAYNHGYQGREHDYDHHDRHRDNHSRDDDYRRHGADRVGSRGAGPMYAEPHAPPHHQYGYEKPPLYDDAVSSRYSRPGGRSYY